MSQPGLTTLRGYLASTKYAAAVPTFVPAVPTATSSSVSPFSAILFLHYQFQLITFGAHLCITLIDEEISTVAVA